jgi:hypothetical protein
MHSPRMAALYMCETPVITTYQTTRRRISEQCAFKMCCIRTIKSQ